MGYLTKGIARILGSCLLVAALGAAPDWRGLPEPIQVRFPGRLPSHLVDIGFDHRGGVWLSGERVVRYDSLTTQLPAGPQAMGDRGFVEDQAGRLWVARPNQIGFYSAGDDQSWSFTDTTGDLPESWNQFGAVWYIEPTEHGLVFLASNGILRKSPDDRWEVWKFPAERRPVPLRLGKRFAVAVRTGEVWELTCEGPLPFYPNLISDQMMILAGRMTPDGEILLIHHRGSIRISGSGVVTRENDALRSVTQNLWTCSAELPDGRIALGTYQGGLAIYNPDTDALTWLNQSNGLPNNAICNLKFDAQGNLWVLTTASVHRIANAARSLRLAAPGGASKWIEFDDSGVFVTGSLGSHRLSADGRQVTLESIYNGQVVISTRPVGDGSTLVHTLSGLYHYTPDSLNQGRRLIRGVNRGHSLFKYPGLVDTWHVHIDNQSYQLQYRDNDWQVREIHYPFPDRMFVNPLIMEVGDRVWILEDSSKIYGYRFSDDSFVEYVLNFPSASTQRYAIHDTKIALIGEDWYGIFDTQSGVSKYWNYQSEFHPVTSIFDADDPDVVWLLCNRTPNVLQTDAVWYLVKTHVTRGVQEVHHLEMGELSGSRFSLALEPGARALWLGDAESIRRIPREAWRRPPVPTTAPRLWAEPNPEKPDVPLRVRFDPPAPGRLDTAVVEVRVLPFEPDWRPATEPFRDLSGLRPGSFTLEARYRSADGQPGPVASHAFVIPPPWYLHPASLTGFSILLVCAGAIVVRRRLAILEARRMELERLVAERTADLVKANAAKTEFIAQMSHELRNPMNGVVGLSEILLQRLTHPEDRSLVQTLCACAGLLDQMIGDVLDVARIDSNQVKLELRPFTVQSLVEDAVAIVTWDANRLEKQIIVDLGPVDAPVIEGDPSKLQQIIVNFLSNACKYSNQPRIHLRAHISAPVPQRRLVRIEIIDGGPGLSPEDRRKIFDRFYRTESARHSGRRGTGLGLAICRELAERMGGSVGVEANDAGGSTFFLEISCPLAGRSIASVTGTGASFAGRHALVVDDMDHNRLVAGALLSHLGFIVDYAENGAQALASLASGQYDCALLDWDLPDFDGVEVARRFRASHPDSRTRLIACTAFATPDRIEACLAAGMQEHISKPITDAKLRRALGAALASAPPTPATEKLDLSALRLLAGQDPDRLAAQIDRFLLTLDTEIDALEAADAARDRAQVRRHLHRLLSHASIISTAGLLTVIEEVQESAHNAPDDIPCPDLPRVRAAARALASDLRPLAAASRAGE